MYHGQRTDLEVLFYLVLRFHASPQQSAKNFGFLNVYVWLRCLCAYIATLYIETEPLRRPLSPSYSLQLQADRHADWYFTCSRDCNSDPHTCETITLPADPSSWSPQVTLKKVQS